MSTTESKSGGFVPDTSPVPPIVHDADQFVRVRRGELRDWATEVEHVMRSPIDAPGLWKVGSLTVVVTAVFYGLTLIPIYAPKTAPSPSLWAIIPAAFLFALGVIAFAFTAHLDKDIGRMNMDRAEVLADKIRFADVRTPKDGDDA